jgi:hypothetical protein
MIQLPNAFNIQNSKKLMRKLQKTDTQGNIMLCSFDITNMYSNIPQKELILVTDNSIQNNNVNTVQKDEVILLVNTILKQNYIQHNSHQYKQEGLPMGAPHPHSLQKYSCNTRNTTTSSAHSQNTTF